MVDVSLFYQQTRGYGDVSIDGVNNCYNGDMFLANRIIMMYQSIDYM